jgi:hypothetical protein
MQGIWSGRFQVPAAYRADHKNGQGALQAMPTSAGRDSDRTCQIKGNISSTGEKIYHMPGGKYYDRTIISLSNGERWFCSPAEAEQAGWRAAQAER